MYQYPHPSALIEALAEKLANHELVIISDYDGTLSPFVKNPEEAWPDATAKQALINLHNIDANAVLVHTGRPITTFDQLFWHGNDAPLFQFNIIGQHGVEKRIAEQVTYLPLSSQAQDLLQKNKEAAKALVTELRKQYNIPDDTNHILYEDKPCSFALHWRSVAGEPYAQKVQDAFMNFMNPKNPSPSFTNPNPPTTCGTIFAKQHYFQVASGEMNLEFKLAQEFANKGLVLQQTLDDTRFPYQGKTVVWLCDEPLGTDGPAIKEVKEARNGFVIQVLQNDPTKEPRAPIDPVANAKVAPTHTVINQSELGSWLTQLYEKTLQLQAAHQAQNSCS